MTIKSCLLLLLFSACIYAPEGRSNTLTAGVNFSCVIKAGNVLCWGANEYKQLGDGTSVASRFTPGAVSGFDGDAVAVDAGGYHACALTTTGGVKCWGINMDGELGDGTTTTRSTPVFVTGLESGVQAISAGVDHTCALTNAGAVLCWGYNTYGELGDGTTDSHLVPTPVSGLESGVKEITTSELGSCALTTSGAVFCWGDNLLGGVGDGIETQTPRTLPTQVYGLTSGTKTIASGHYHSCAVSMQGAVSCWGDNRSGQLGDQTRDNRFAPVPVLGLSGPQVAITAGWQHTCAISSLGAAHCWGNDILGQLGADKTWAHLAGVPPVPVFHLPWRAIELVAGSTHTCALTSGGLFCWGDNSKGAVGNSTADREFSPQRVNGLNVPTTSWHPPPH